MLLLDFAACAGVFNSATCGRVLQDRGRALGALQDFVRSNPNATEADVLAVLPPSKGLTELLEDYALAVRVVQSWMADGPR